MSIFSHVYCWRVHDRFYYMLLCGNFYSPPPRLRHHAEGTNRLLVFLPKDMGKSRPQTEVRIPVIPCGYNDNIEHSILTLRTSYHSCSYLAVQMSKSRNLCPRGASCNCNCGKDYHMTPIYVDSYACEVS